MWMDASRRGFSVSILDPGAQFWCCKIRTSRATVNSSLPPYIRGKFSVHKMFRRLKISKMSSGRCVLVSVILVICFAFSFYLFQSPCCFILHKKIKKSLLKNFDFMQCLLLVLIHSFCTRKNNVLQLVT